MFTMQQPLLKNITKHFSCPSRLRQSKHHHPLFTSHCLFLCVSHSVSMTAISTTLAIGTLPLNMFIYGRRWLEHANKLPYVNMVITVVYMWVAVLIGYFAGRKWPKSVPYFTKVMKISHRFLCSRSKRSSLFMSALIDQLFRLSNGAVRQPVHDATM